MNSRKLGGRSRVGPWGTLALALLSASVALGPVQAQPRPPLVAVLYHGPDEVGAARRELLREGLRDLGYVEDSNYRIELRVSGNRLDRLPELARELLRQNPAVAVGITGVAAHAFWNETKSVPIVLAAGIAPPEMIATLARPGGNVTGVLNQAVEFTPKLFELVRDVAPRAERVVALSSGHGLGEAEVRELSRAAAKELGLSLIEAIANSPEEIEQLGARCERERCDALVALPDATSPATRFAAPLGTLLARLRIADASQSIVFARDQGLIGYAPDGNWAVRRSARYVDRILKGVRPADLPAERGDKFELVVNLRNAKARGILVPQSVVLRADEVVE
jgi:putative ABC transport system substrate-binding protein